MEAKYLENIIYKNTIRHWQQIISLTFSARFWVGFIKSFFSFIKFIAKGEFSVYAIDNGKKVVCTKFYLSGDVVNYITPEYYNNADINVINKHKKKLNRKFKHVVFAPFVLLSLVVQLPAYFLTIKMLIKWLNIICTSFLYSI